MGSGFRVWGSLCLGILRLSPPPPIGLRLFRESIPDLDRAASASVERPESGRDCLICAEFGEERRGRSLQSMPMPRVCWMTFDRLRASLRRDRLRASPTAPAPDPMAPTPPDLLAGLDAALISWLDTPPISWLEDRGSRACLLWPEADCCWPEVLWSSQEELRASGGWGDRSCLLRPFPLIIGHV